MIIVFLCTALLLAFAIASGLAYGVLLQRRTACALTICTPNSIAESQDGIEVAEFVCKHLNTLA